jgi:DNA-binding XRE family transcriptional regulator
MNAGRKRSEHAECGRNRDDILGHSSVSLNGKVIAVSTVGQRFGGNVRQLREERCMTQQELASQADTTLVWIQDIEAGIADPELRPAS